MSDENTSLSWHLHPPYGTRFQEEAVLSPTTMTYVPNGVKLMFTRGQAEGVLAWITETLHNCEAYVKSLPPLPSRHKRELEEAVRRQKEALQPQPIPEDLRDVTITPAAVTPSPEALTALTISLPKDATPEEIEAHNRRIVEHLTTPVVEHLTTPVVETPGEEEPSE
jgi:hypothetical protein